MKKQCIIFILWGLSVFASATDLVKVRNNSCVITNTSNEPVWVWWDENGNPQLPTNEQIRHFFQKRMYEGDYMSIYQIITDPNVYVIDSCTTFYYRIMMPNTSFTIIFNNMKQHAIKKLIRKNLRIIPHKRMLDSPIFQAIPLSNIEMFNYQSDSVTIDKTSIR